MSYFADIKNLTEMGCVGCDICSSRPVPFHTTRPAVFLRNFLQIDLVCLRVVQEASDKPRIRERTDQANIYILDLKKPVHFGGGEVGRFVLYNTTFGQRKNVPVFSGFCRKLARTKTEQITDKASECNGRKAFSRVSTGGVNFVISFILYSFYFLTICSNFPFQLRLRHRQSTPPPPTRAGIRKSNTVLPPTAEEALAATEPLRRPPRFR